MSRPSAGTTSRPTSARPRSRSPRGASRGPSPYRLFLLVGGLCAALGTTVAHWGLGWSWFWAYLASINLVTLCLYGYDKRAAVDGRLRVPERVLHVAAFVGGTPGAYLGQRVFRHKTLKGTFRFWFWALLVTQMAILVLYWWLIRR
ncbi:MAG TPA: DUF1294 domain-containing protein [Humisphaera sp.]